MQYTLLAKDKNSEARCGVLTTAHGEIHTPVFMPVGTVGSVKAVHMRELKEDIRAEIILGIPTIFIYDREPKFCRQPEDCTVLMAGTGRY